MQLPSAAIAAAMLALCGASSAIADSSISSNWAGYAVHRAGVRFREVSAVWRQPNASCKSGNQAYSAVWVGLGGYSQSSNALEQVGTELDCSASGRVLSSAWYEIVPAPSQPVNLKVRPGDLMASTVVVVGHRVDLRLDNLSRHRSFTKALGSAAIDVTSAEWIVEAPSDCISATACQTLPLANFGTTAFWTAATKTTSGVVGGIANRAWDATSITLSPGGHRYVAYNGAGRATGIAKPSRLSSAGSVFSVSYNKASVEGNPFFGGRRTAVGAGSLLHPGR